MALIKSQTTVDEEHRLEILDILRIFSALWVGIYHLSGGHGWFSTLKHPYQNILENNQFGNLSGFIRLGFLGTPIFFVISGFVIVTSSKNKSADSFLIARLSRLLPAYIFSVVLTLAVFKFGYSGANELSVDKILSTLNLTWLTNSSSPIQGSYWTLWPEVRFYGLFLIFVLLFRKNQRFERRTTIFFIGWLCTLWFGLTSNSILGLFGISDYAVFFILGGFIALASSKELIKGVSPFLFAALLLAIFNLRHWIFAWDSKHPADWRAGCVLFVISLALIAASRRYSFKNTSIQKIIMVLGRSSYAFYLLQEGVGMPMTSFFAFHGMQIWLAIALSLLNVLVVSVAFTMWVEASLIKLVKDGFGTGLRMLLAR